MGGVEGRNFTEILPSAMCSFVQWSSLPWVLRGGLASHAAVRQSAQPGQQRWVLTPAAHWHATVASFMALYVLTNHKAY